MQCDICFRTGGYKLPFLCPTDARNRLYEPRLQNAIILLEKEALDQKITSLVSNPDTEGQKNTPEDSAARQTVATALGEKSRAVDRTQQIIAYADELRAKVEKAREELAKKKANIASRRSELASLTNGVGSRRKKQIEDIEKSNRIIRYNWNKVNNSFATSRTYLCGEAAKLYGLRRLKRSSGHDDYEIGRVGILDLRALNTGSAAQVSTAFSHIVHLLMLSMHYLAIRLPAEITLPHREHPQPTIYPLSTSHIPRTSPPPGNIPGQNSNTSPTESRHDSNVPRPRPLFINKPLPLLVNEDPMAYSFFLEGVILLAYNIAWVCRSQGIPVGEECGFDDICNVGKNLYNLLIGPRSRPTPSSRVPSTQSTPSNGDDRKAGYDPTMGKFSHGTGHAFLGSAEGIDFIKSWKLMNPTKLTDKLKSLLASEVAHKEWEVIDQDTLAGQDEMGDDGVIIGARKEGVTNPNLGMQSFMSMRTVMDAVEMVGGDGERKPGTSGWTKLKPR